MQRDGDPPLAGQRILVLEDQVIVALSVRDMLMDLGATVAGPALTLADGYDLALKAPIDAAVLDLWIHGERSYAVGEALRHRSIPFVMTGSFDHEAEPPGFAAVPRLMKPFSAQELTDALLAALGQQRLSA